MSGNTEDMLEAALEVHSRYRGRTPAQRKAWHAGRRGWKAWYRQGHLEWVGEIEKPSMKSFVSGEVRSTVRRMKNRFRNGRVHAVVARVMGTWPPPVGWVNFGRLSSTIPISRNFGLDRGTAIDRYYIEKFLAEHAADITGHVLEVGDDAYSRRFGSNITRRIFCTSILTTQKRPSTVILLNRE